MYICSDDGMDCERRCRDGYISKSKGCFVVFSMQTLAAHVRSLARSPLRSREISCCIDNDVVLLPACFRPFPGYLRLPRPLDLYFLVMPIHPIVVDRHAERV